MSKVPRSSLLKTNAANIPGTDTHKYREFKNKFPNLQAYPSEDEPISKKKRIVPDWDYTNSNSFFQINLGDGIGFANLPRICKVITDTEIFGRLNHIAQLGLCSFVYPEANHSRRSHSFGTAHLACLLVLSLVKQKINGSPPMTGSEMLCVIIAALCHDLGHGPFSHLCEEFMVQKDGTKLTHEEMSVLLFEKILKDNPIAKSRLEQYLTEDHFQLIKCLIDPPTDKPWELEYVGPEKAFLFAIVNNPRSGLDVDKMDYLLRDSKRTGVDGITYQNIEYCLGKAKIIDCGHYKWLGFPENKPEIVSIFFEKRQRFHEIVYSHRTVVAFSEMLKKAIKRALPEIKITKGTKTDIPLKQCFWKENLDLYIMLTDEFLRTQIINSTLTSEAIIEAQKIFSDINNRKHWKPILAFKRLDSYTQYPCLEPSLLKTVMEKCNISFKAIEILIVRKDFNAGRGRDVNPMNSIPFYSRNNNEHSARFLQFPKPPFESTVFIIAPHHCKASDIIEIEKVLREHAENNSIPPPTKLFRNDENSG